MRRLLLSCGILSSLYFAAINLLVPLQWSEYSFFDHTVSELTAIGAPTRPLWLILGAPYPLLLFLFGLGVLKTSSVIKRLRPPGFALLLYSLTIIYWPPMHQRIVLAVGGATLTDTLHLVWTGLTLVLYIVIMFTAARALDVYFRWYTVISVLGLMLFGILTSIQAPNVSANLATPLMGLWERLNIGIFLLWVIVFAVTLFQKHPVSR